MIRVFHDLEAASSALADHVISAATSAIDSRGRFDLVLSGGSTPRRTYQLLKERSRGNASLWGKVHVYWGDERYVPHDHPDSNYLLAKEAMLDALDLPAQNVHPVPTDCGSPTECAARYGKMFPAKPDLMLLGMGSDGHTASLFPGTPSVSRTDAPFIASAAPREPRDRICAASGTILAAREIIVLVSGADKADALCSVFAADGSAEATPARIAVDSDWFVDEDAAALLDGANLLESVSIRRANTP